MEAQIKQQAHALIDELPAEAAVEDLMRELYELRSIERALADVQAGRLTPNEEARRIVLLGRRP